MDEQQIVQTEENRQPAKDQNELDPPAAAMDVHAVHLDQLTRAVHSRAGIASFANTGSHESGHSYNGFLGSPLRNQRVN